MTTRTEPSDPLHSAGDRFAANELPWRAVTGVLWSRRWLLVLAPLTIGLLALGAAYLVPPTYTATTTFLPPQQAQSTAAAALSSLGSLAGLAGSGIKTQADQYLAFLQSATVSDRMVDAFKLMDAYKAELRIEARERLARNVVMSIGKKDGVISIAVDDHSPQRAADMANRYVDELRRLTSTLAVTEAQQRRVFFEQQLEQARDKLTRAQMALQASGVDQGTLKAEPKSAAEAYARLRAEITAAEVRLASLRDGLADHTPEVRHQQAAITTMRAQLSRAEQPATSGGNADYVSRYREFKYQETLFELFARQYELARADESRDGALIQVIDVAQVPERKSKPRRGMIAIAATLGAAVMLSVIVVLRAARRHGSTDIGTARGRRRQW